MRAAPFEPERFDETVAYYVRHRIRYADRLIRMVCSDAGLTRSHRAMDLGCGPGFIANQLAPFAQEVIGVDPNSAMLDAAWEEARAVGADNVDFRLGSSLDLSIVDGPFQLVTMGRSFHWMDRETTLSSLERLVADEGSIALLSDHMIDAPENRWWPAFVSICTEFGKRDEFMPKSKTWEPDVSILMRSAFSDLHKVSLFTRHSWTIDDAIGLALSRSTTSHSKLGGAKPQFEAAMRKTLDTYLIDGRLHSLVEQMAIMARRPSCSNVAPAPCE